MPFAPAARPSIQVGILRTLLDGAGIAAREFHGTLDFFEILAREGHHSQYQAGSPSLLSEWYFSERPFDPDPAGPDREAAAYLHQVAGATGFPVEKMRRIREAVVPPFLDALADQVAESGAHVACFSLSFAQRNAAFALSARLKARRPDLLTVFGGAGSQIFEEACREYMRIFPAVDVMLLGEAEERFPLLVGALLERGPLDGIPGLLHRLGREVRLTAPEPPPVPAEARVIPSYAGWIERARALPRTVQARLDVALPVEIGRGCTWADHAACRFCAFTFHGRYRARRPDQVLEEVSQQVRRHGVRSIYIVDNVVPRATLHEVLPAMARAVPGLVVPFVEVLSTLGSEDLEAMAASGVVLVQPGTECFDDGLLKRVGKGTTTLHNVRFLKLARESGVGVSHNLLLGVPGATPAEVDSQRRTLEKLTHLDPPQVLELQLVRFSDYHARSEHHALRGVRPHPMVAATLPEGADAARVAYEFVSDVDDDAMTRLYTPTVAAMVAWHQRWRRSPRPYFIHDADSEGVTLLDGRGSGADPLRHRLEGLAAAAYLAVARDPRPAGAVAARLGEAFPGTSPAAVEEILRGLERAGLVLEGRGRFLALSVDGDRLRRLWRDLPPRPPGSLPSDRRAGG